jgi:mRNA-degrading endonuclease RelE of RelBE toxin-antitoxin system
MAVVRLAAEAREDFDALPLTVRVRVRAIFARLQQWPNVSGAKPLKKEWAGHCRIRSGDWRIIFRPVSPEMIVVRIKHRSEVYDN